MRKLFLLIPVMLLTLATNATTHEIGSGTSNILGTTVASAADGDVIILTDNGPYINSKSASHDYTYLNKNLTIQAADGKTPVVQYEVPFRSTDGKTVKFIGITFDGTSLTSYDFYFRFNDANNNNLEFEDCEFQNISKYVFDVYTAFKANSLKLTNCKLHDISSRGILNRGTLTYLEINGGKIYNFTGYPVLDNYGGATLGKVKINGTEFYGNTQDIISGTATSHADSCIINNGYFHNNSRSAVYFAASTVEGVETCDGVIVKNSTFANNDLSASSRSVIEVGNYNATEAANIEVTVDHCTFYNNTTINYDYSCVRSRKSTKVTISNSIFAYPSAIDFYATNCYGGTISNTIVYNLNYGHRHSGDNPALSNTITADPKFRDAANNDFTLQNNWSSGEISPAYGAGTDGSDLGDPRWYTEEIIPSTSIASAYDLLPTKAKFTGTVELNASDKIHFTNTSVVTDGEVKWKLNVTKTCHVSAVVDVETSCTNGRQLTLTVKDADGNTVATLAQPSATYNDADINLGQIVFSETGDYTFLLSNSLPNSNVVLERITLTYVGGAVQNIATDANTTLEVADAWFTSGATRAEGQISYSTWNSEDSWVKWNIATSETKFYDLTLNFNSTNAHSMAVNIYEDEEASPVETVSESYTTTTGDLTISGRIELVGGKNYIVKVTNPTSGSQAKVTNIVFAPVAATSTALPNTLAFSKAVLSEKAFIQDDMLYFNEIGDTDPRGQWAHWEVTTDHDGLFLFTMGVTSANEQSYKITILDNSENVLDYYETSPGTGDKELEHYFSLATGDYFVKVENTRSYSKGHLVSIVVTEPDDVITIDEAATDNTSWADKVVNKDAEGPLFDVQIIRTIVAGMYNTLCLPFEVTHAQAKDIFGADVQLRTLESAELEEEGRVLNLAFTSTSGMYPGTPHLIKTSRDIVNPVFTDVKFTRAAPAATTKTNANFIGNFVAGTIDADPDNLFLGANNTLYFPTVNMDILGMRAYFKVHDAPSGVIQRARIVENEQILTDIELIEQPSSADKKILENGQLFIIRDGIRYNVMGARVK